MKISFAIITLTICFFSISAIAQRGRIVFDRPDPAAAVKARIAAEQEAANRQWQQNNPWFVDPKWRLLTNSIAVAEKQLSQKQTEVSLLVQADKKDTARYKELMNFIGNASATILNWQEEKRKIEADYRLKQYYKQNKDQ